MSGRRGVLGGLAALGVFGPEAARSAAVAQPLKATARTMRGVSSSAGEVRGMLTSSPSNYELAFDNPLVQALVRRESDLREFYHALGDVPAMLGNKSCAPWFRRMVALRKMAEARGTTSALVRKLLGEENPE